MILRVIGVFHRYCISIFSQFLFVRLPLIKNIDCISSWGLSLIRFTLANLPSIFRRGKSLSSSFFFILLFSFFFSICVYIAKRRMWKYYYQIKSNQVQNKQHSSSSSSWFCVLFHPSSFFSHSLTSFVMHFLCSIIQRSVQSAVGKIWGSFIPLCS